MNYKTHNSMRRLEQGSYPCVGRRAWFLSHR